MLSRINNNPNIEESFLPTYDIASLRNCFATFRINIFRKNEPQRDKFVLDIPTLEGREH